MKAVIHATGAIGEVLGIERRDDGNDYVYFQGGLCKPISEVGFLNPYEQYEEDCYDWANFRREAAKEALCVMISGGYGRGREKEQASLAVRYANELIEALKEEKNLPIEKILRRNRNKQPNGGI